MSKLIGIPIKVLHEAEGHIVSVELRTSALYRGKIERAEDNMNMRLSSVTVTAPSGKQSTLEHAYVRGSNIRFVVLPDMIKNAPMFKRKQDANRGVGRGNVLAARKANMGMGRGMGRGGGF